MRSFILVFGLAFSILLHVGMLTSAGLASVISNAFGSVFGVGTVLGVAGEGLTLAQKRLATSEADLKTTKAKNAQLARERDAAKANISRLDGELGTARKKTASLDADLKGTKKKNLELLREVSDFRSAKLVMYRGNKRLLQHAVSDTSSRISKRTAAGASRNLAATFGEAWPLAGTAVIVAATAMELHDACVIMRDLHELEVAFNPELAFAPEAQAVCGMKVPTKQELWEALRASPSAAWKNVRQAIPDVPPLDLSAFNSLTIQFPWD